jgi:predicted nucleic acid-binding OB-fold protein
MFNELRNNGILLLFVITKWPFIPKSEQKDIIQEAVSLLGGQSKLIYRTSSQGYRALECEPKKSYIIPVNSKKDEVLGIRVGIMNINTLRKILISKLDEESQGKLIQLYKNNLNFWTKLGYGAIEILDDIGIKTTQIVLTEEENNIYKQVKNEDNIIKSVTPVMKMIIDKHFPST